MPPFERVLCALDFSDNSADALIAAQAFANAHHSPLVAVTVVDPLLLQAVAVTEAEELVAARTLTDLGRFVATILGETAAARVETHAVTGEPAREILRAAETSRADLIVVGTHGLGGLTKLVFGSTADRLLRNTGTAVLVVPRGSQHALAAGDPRRVVICLPADRPSQSLAADAARAAAPFHAELIAVHIVEPVHLPPGIRAMRSSAELLETANVKLAVTAATISSQPVQLILRRGSVEEEIPEIAREEAAGLVIVGLGRPGSMEHRPGITAYRIVRASPVPVLALPERLE